MSYTITNNTMYVRDDAGNLVPVSMVASGADQTIQAIQDTAAAAEAQIDTKVTDANAEIEAKTDEQVARIPEVTTLVEDVNGLKDDLVKAENTLSSLTVEENFSSDSTGYKFFKFSTVEGGVYEFTNNTTVSTAIKTFDTENGNAVETVASAANARFMRISLKGTGANLIITLDEPIE